MAPAVPGLVALALLGWGTAAPAGPLDPYLPVPPKGLELDPDLVPPETPITPARVALGRRLFFDPRLSRDGTVSCASCHRPRHAWADGLPRAVGIDGRVGPRNTPSILNRILSPEQFWDGRAATLEAQALGPIAAPAEMDLPIPEAVARLAADPVDQAEFQAAFGGPPDAARLGLALAAFERTLLTGDAPVDQDPPALSPAAARGFAIYQGPARCAECHGGRNFTDEGYHNLGVGMDAQSPDLGRFTVTGREMDRGAFRSPSLRNVALTAPYMHDGSMATLEAVVDFYIEGGRPNPWLSPRIRPVPLSPAERADLLAFLREGLTGSIPGPLPDPP